ncbi:unnamed protein product, partial [Ectocarpus fasciculatus]
MLLTESMNAGAHGHIHELLGGAWSSDWFGFFNRTEEIVLPFVHTIVPLMKYLWRANYLQCETKCDFSVLWADCRCTLSAEAVAGQTPSEASARSANLHNNSTLPASKHRTIERLLSAPRASHICGGGAKPRQ